MSNYVTYEEVTKEVLDKIKTGDLVKINDWKKPMRVKGVSKNYVAMVQKQFKDTYYSVIEKKPWDGTRHNAMCGGCFHCGKDDWIFGSAEFNYDFDNQEAVNKYLDEFEREETHLSVRNAIPISAIQITA